MNCTHLTGRLWELCTGNCPPERPCTPQQVEAYRAALLAEPGSPATTPAPASAPTLLARAATFARALAGHALDGFAHVEEAEYERRLAICRTNACGQYAATPQGGHCKLCGCGLAGTVVAKCRWKSEKCPAGKW